MTYELTVDVQRAAVRDALKPVRRIAYTNGGQGTATDSASITSAGLRFVVRLPATTFRWRIKLRNYNSKTMTAKDALTGSGVAFGGHAPGALGDETGNFVGNAATQLVAAGFAIPGDATWYTSDWFTDSAVQFQEGKEFVVALAWSAGSAVTVPRGIGQCFSFATATDALNPALSSANIPSGIPIDMQIEYECRTEKKVVLWVGDSISEGQGGSASRNNPWYLAYPRLWAARNNAIVVNISQAGATSFDWQKSTATEDRWKRVDLASMSFDAIVLALGANDAQNSTNLGTHQSYMGTIANNARSLAGDVRLFIANVAPRGLDAPREALRVSYNDWTNGLPLRAAGTFDMSAAVRDPADATILLAANSFDGTHLTRTGYNRMAGAVSMSI